jgi:signal transduction histidine kinase
MRQVTDQIALGLNNANNFAELRKTNESLESAYIELERLDQAKTEFLSIASHQLRTPLSAIRGYLSLLEDGDYGELEPRQRTVLGKLQDNVQRLVALVGDLLSLARIEAGTTANSIRFVMTDIRTLVDQAVDEVDLKAKSKGLSLVWERPETEVSAEIDAEKIAQVIMNLADNAVYYTAEGEVRLTLTREGERIRLVVKDTGMGMDAESRHKLFTKFYRSPNAVKMRPDGTGIGLYVAKMMVEAHGGSIRVESEPGAGTAFFVELPVKRPVLTEDDKKDAPA